MEPISRKRPKESVKGKTSRGSGNQKNKNNIDILTGIVYNNFCVVRRERMTGILYRYRGVAQLG